MFCLVIFGIFETKIQIIRTTRGVTRIHTTLNGSLAQLYRVFSASFVYTSGIAQLAHRAHNIKAFYTAVFRVLTATKSGTYRCTLSIEPNWSWGIIFVGEGSPELTEVVAVVLPDVEP